MRPIDADALKEEFTCNCDEWICNIIDNEPTIEPKTKVIAQVTFDEDKLREIVHEAVERIKEEYDIVDNPDAVSVVRCKDCKYDQTRRCPLYTAKFGYCDEDFCSCGEREGE